jgi:hypothetical protein
VNLRPTLPPSVRRLEARRRNHARRDFIRGVRRYLSSPGNWSMLLLAGVGVVLLLWLTTHAVDALSNPVQSALDLVRLGPKTRH